MRITVLIFCFVLFFSCEDKKKEYKPMENTIVQNEVVIKEVEQTSAYTYLLVQKGGEEFWMAVAKTDLSVGEKVYFEEAIEMQNFESKELNKVFDRIVFANEISKNPITSETKKKNYIAQRKRTMASLLDSIKLEPVPGGQRIGDLYSNADDYKNEKVKVRGQVIKVNMDIMDRNWVHLVDGTKGKDRSDLTFTTQELVKVGDTVVFEGVLAIDKEFGAGYNYPLIIEDAVLLK